MQKLPDDLGQKFSQSLIDRNLSKPDQYFYNKWLRYYWDFCYKYHHEPFLPGCLPLYLDKLQEKKQSVQQQNQAKFAISVFYELNPSAKQSSIQENKGGYISSEPASKTGNSDKKAINPTTFQTRNSQTKTYHPTTESHQAVNNSRQSPVDKQQPEIKQINYSKKNKLLLLQQKILNQNRKLLSKTLLVTQPKAGFQFMSNWKMKSNSGTIHQKP